MSRITKEELLQNYEWKTMKRVLKREFPWLVDIDVNSENLQNYISVLIELVIDPFVFSDTFNVGIKKSILVDLMNKEEVKEYYLPMIFDVSDRFETELYDRILNLLKMVRDSKSLPDELIFSQSRPINLDTIIIKPSDHFVKEAKKRLYGQNNF